MHCAIVSIFPEMFRALTDFGITGRAIQQEKLKLSFLNPRDFSDNAHRTVDDRPYGGGPGMVMMAEPLMKAVEAAKAILSTTGQKIRVIAMSPQGKTFDQRVIGHFLASNAVPVFVAGRYDGIDQRFIDTVVDEEWSLGDYVISGGELAIMVILDALSRWIHGVLGHPGSVKDSFAEGLLGYPQYTRPGVWAGMAVPTVLTSGDHRAIAAWRSAEQWSRTQDRRPDLLKAPDKELKINKFNLKN